ncbi:MAG: hypothetical protein LQ352_007548 [Teloschistes flavicans]|nr:MAG: hypothetical protein LQ352_007548 [Teloschistes flavicans]
MNDIYDTTRQIQPSRITRDLIAASFSPSLHLLIAQESLHQLRLSQEELREMEREYAEILRMLTYERSMGLSESQLSELRERLGRLEPEIMGLREELEGKRGVVGVLERDIELLKGLVARDENNESRYHVQAPRVSIDEGHEETKVVANWSNGLINGEGTGERRT